MTYRSVFRPGLFAGQSTIVIGGGSGVGRCTAHELVALGARVALVGRTPEKPEKVRAELGVEAATAHVCDIREEAVVNNNLTGGFLMARECYKQAMEASSGAIVNIIADMWNGMPGMGHSGAARAGMLNFTETTACEWATSGVRVNAVAPTRGFGHAIDGDRTHGSG